MPFHVALVSRTRRLDFGELMIVSAALQKQVLRDFLPAWGIVATVDAFERLEDAPTDYWQVTVEDFNGTGGFAGVHAAVNFQPFARVAFSNVWSLTASHEVLEMLADPFRSTLRAGASEEDPNRRVQYLLEICDPCQDPACGYTVDGVLVSDFVTPEYFEPVSVAGVRYSFAGTVTRPHDVADGGYLTWLDPATNAWTQLSVDDGTRTFRTLHVAAAPAMTLREKVNRATREPYWWRHGLEPGDPVLERVARVCRGVRKVSRARGRAVVHRIKELGGRGRGRRGAKTRARRAP